MRERHYQSQRAIVKKEKNIIITLIAQTQFHVNKMITGTSK